MSEAPLSHRRSGVRTAVLVLFSAVFPTLGWVLGLIEIAYRNYRFGVLLILLATAFSPCLVALSLPAGREPSPEEIAGEVKPLILEEWKNSPALGQATIERIALTHQGGGRYSGFIDARLGGQRERLSLEVVLDRETIRWQVEAEAN
jgi:hypothetical protein